MPVPQMGETDRYREPNLIRAEASKGIGVGVGIPKL